MVTEGISDCVSKKSPKNNSGTNGEATKIEKKLAASNSENNEDNKEQAPEVSTSTSDDTVLPTKPTQHVQLSLTPEEGEICADDNEDDAKVEAKGESEVVKATVGKSKRYKKTSINSVWVSNISKTTKAADLKKLFSENFKVESAKIVTNGKSFFGYILLQTAEMAQKSVKALNGFNLAGKVISVSVMRPDIRAARASVAREIVKRGKETQINQKVEDTKEDKNNKDEKNDKEVIKSKEDVTKSKTEEAEDKGLKDQIVGEEKTKTGSEKKKKKSRREPSQVVKDDKDKQIDLLNKQLDTASSELRIATRRLREANGRAERELARRRDLEKEVLKLETQLREERRRMDKEREEVERRKKLDDLRYEETRTILNKELDECKRLREYLQAKVDDMRVGKSRRSRSPRGRSPQRRSDVSGRSLTDKRYGSADQTQRPRRPYNSPSKHRGYAQAPEHQRSPPPPPRLGRRSPLLRNRERSPISKPVKIPRSDGHSSAGNRGQMAHYPSNGGGQEREALWSSSYNMAYDYGTMPGQSAFPLVEGKVRPATHFHDRRDLEYSGFLKGLPGGIRKY